PCDANGDRVYESRQAEPDGRTCGRPSRRGRATPAGRGSGYSVAVLDDFFRAELVAFAGNAVAVTVEQAKAAWHSGCRTAAARPQRSQADLECFAPRLVFEPAWSVGRRVHRWCAKTEYSRGGRGEFSRQASNVPAATGLRDRHGSGTPAGECREGIAKTASVRRAASRSGGDTR